MTQTLLITANRRIDEVNAELERHCEQLQATETQRQEAANLLENFHRLACENAEAGNSLSMEKVILEGHLRVRVKTFTARRRPWKKLLGLLRFRSNY